MTTKKTKSTKSSVQETIKPPILESGRLHYLATPYSKFPGGIYTAHHATAILCAELIRRFPNLRFFCPITHTHAMSTYGLLDPFDHSIWLPFDLAIMEKCDALVVAMLPSWEISYGIKHEIDWFKAVRRPIIYLEPHTLELSHEPPEESEPEELGGEQAGQVSLTS